MSKRYFQKVNARIFILDKKSRPIPFERLAENNGVIALDDQNPDHQIMIESLDEAVLRKVGGVIDLGTEEAYQELKKNLDPSKAPPKRRIPGIRIADQNPIPELTQPRPASDATAPGAVAPVVASTPVRRAAEPGTSEGESANPLPPGINGGRGHKVRTAKVRVASDGAPTLLPPDTGGGGETAKE